MDPGLSDDIRSRARELLEELGISRELRISEEFLAETIGLIRDDSNPLDLKIAAASVTEMREAFRMFAPYRNVPKATIFGSARTQPHDPLWEHTRRLAASLAEEGWMVVTGAGPGIMQAAMEGAGRAHSIGVSIRLPFEQGANPVIAGDEKYVSMKYFFTRKLMLVKESQAFVCLPGGFGTLDETFELLTLTQTGKGLPVPIVFLDTPGDRYWETVHEFVESQLIPRGFVSPGDTGLYFITDSCDEAVAEIERFYSNYDSIRYVGDDLVIRLRHEPTDAQLAELTSRFGHLVAEGEIRRTTPFSIERRQDDRLELHRIAFEFAKHGYSDLRAMIDMLNSFVPAPGATDPAD
ncbi:MAG: TIGR00730 family Rossman fold protein [Ilumatobacter sp.]|nr:MAG: TIGR00730 family Rossman fold protein [Ilumatobacter sp.]